MDLNKKRGPDNEGTYINKGVSLGHNLLAITDNAQNGRQPWDTQLSTLVFNGELFSYPENKQEFTDLRTNTDTEVLSRGLEKHGIDYVKQLSGMWAFAWLDKRNGRLYLSRDRGGIKPLYISIVNGRLAFSSSISSILSLGGPKQITNFALRIYTQLGYVPGPATLLKGINKVCPGQVIEYDVALQKVVRKYYELPQLTDEVWDFEKFDFLLEKAVKRSMMGLREVGLLLSGGLDSSLIYFKLKKLGYEPKTFSTYFEDGGEFNEDCEYASRSNLNNLLARVNEQDFHKAAPEVIRSLEYPRFGRNIPAYWLTHKFMAENGIIVVLTGDSGDEMFTGYDYHPQVYPTLKAGGQYKNWIRLTRLNEFISDEEIYCYLKTWYPYWLNGPDYLNNFMRMEQLNHLCEDYLIRNDKIGMDFSMECRMPLLYDEFKNYVMSLPGQFKMGKNFIREYYKDLLPEHVLTKKKSGWSSPYNKWYAPIQDRMMAAVGWFCQAYHMMDYKAAIEANNKTKIAIYHFQIWAKQIGL